MKRSVGYLGPEGTFTHQAVRSVEPDAAHVPFASSLDVVKNVESGELDAGVIPIDNSIEGPVIPSIDALLAFDVVITAMVEVPIRFVAFRARGSTSIPANVIISHPHALAQCQGFVARLGLPTKSASSTAAASAEIRAGEIALSAEVCEEIYDVEAVAHGVQDSLNGITRFARIERVGTPSDPQADATVIAIVPESNSAGVLARIATTFARFGHDLQGLVLRPLETTDFRYVFVFTVMARPTHPELLQCLVALAEAGDRVAVLGSFRSMSGVATSTGMRKMRPLASNSEELTRQLVTGL